MKSVPNSVRWGLGVAALWLACTPTWATEDRELERVLSLFLRAKGLTTNLLHERGKLNLTTKAVPALAAAPPTAAQPGV